MGGMHRNNLLPVGLSEQQFLHNEHGKKDGVRDVRSFRIEHQKTKTKELKLCFLIFNFFLVARFHIFA